jgi:CBS domain-containing protein
MGRNRLCFTKKHFTRCELSVQSGRLPQPGLDEERDGHMSEGPVDRYESLEGIVSFLASVEALRTLERDQLVRIAQAVGSCSLAAREVLIVEGGQPSAQLWVLRDGSLDLLRRDQLVTVMTPGELLGYASLLTQTAPAFTVRARTDCTLYCIPADLSLDLLSREDGVRWLATTQRDALLYAARSLSPMPEVQTLPVTSVMRGAPLVCGPETTVTEAAGLMTQGGRSAILVRAREGLGIVTDTDLREKVVFGGVSRDGPVSAIMTSPVHTISGETLAAEATVAMLARGIHHLPVTGKDSVLIGVVSSADLMSLEGRNPFALRSSFARAQTEDELVAAAVGVSTLFCDLLAAHVEPPLVCRVLTVLHDSLTARLLEFAFERHGAPPVDYAWLVFGSAARHELTLASDQDNGLAYADTDDPAARDYFRRVAEDVNDGLSRCGIEADAHAVLAREDEWRMSASAWTGVFRDCLLGSDGERLMRAAVVFDYRQAAGQLYVERALTEVMHDTPKHARFKAGLGELGSEIRSPLGFRGRLPERLDVKASGLLPIQNLARYHALSRGITIQPTLERLTALAGVDAGRADTYLVLREAYLTMRTVQLDHQAEAVRSRQDPDNMIDTDRLRPLTQATLREALRVVATAQQQLPRHVM